MVHVQLWHFGLPSLSPLAQGNLQFLSAILGYSRDTGGLSQVFTLITQLPVQLKIFCLLSSYNTALLPDLDSPSLTPPPSISAGTGERWLWDAGGRPILSWWEQRQSISLALTELFEGRQARPDRQVQPVMQPPMLLLLPAGKMPQKYAQLLHP